ncbi:MAG: outer membrane lipoprotein-sorting protein [Gammaproteobacteria bacterium]|nr:outer membrane lipoprotein-sorting protein [Gammaproteobacteria bacterium]
MKFNKLLALTLSQGILAAMLSSPAIAQDNQLSAREIMVKNERARKAEISEVAQITMTLINDHGNKRVRKATFILDDTNPVLRKSYMKFSSPKNIKGTSFVQLEHQTRENDRWLYLPALRKTRRISGSSKTDSFVGTDFSFEDFEILDGEVAGEKRSYTILREEKRNGEECWVIEALPATEQESHNSGYSKRWIWVAKAHFQAVHTEFFDRDGTLFKTMDASDFRVVEGSRNNELRPHKLAMNTLRTNHSTIIEFYDFVLNKPLNPKLFTRENLSRG